MTSALEAIERAVASVTDPTDRAQLVAAVRAVSPALVDDVVFGRHAAVAGAAADGELVAVGTPASPGVAVGRVAGSLGAVLDLVEAGRDAVLVVDETTPGDEAALRLAAAVVTRRGGVAAHAAIVARHLGIPAVCATGAMDLDDGATVLVDGHTGEVRRLDEGAHRGSGGAGPIAQLPDALVTLLGWADAVASLRVLANADTPEEAAAAAAMGAAGIGLCRVERAARADADRLGRALSGDTSAMAEVASDMAGHVAGLAAAAPEGPLRVRLLDLAVTWSEGGWLVSDEDEPLGLRGVRLALVAPWLVAAQASAIAALDRPACSLVVPMVSHPAELAEVRRLLDGVPGAGSVELDAMVETPRAALCAGALAPSVSRFAIGTNDLTQLTWGLSRELDVELGEHYRALGAWDRSPFETLDPVGVVRLVALAVETGRAANPGLGVSLCGEQAADPASIAIAAQLGIDEISVSPRRIPAARLAAAHAALDQGGQR